MCAIYSYSNYVLVDDVYVSLCVEIHLDEWKRVEKRMK
jgi:hypothetical protein